ncbi:MAG: hypothetical protein ABJH63_12485 [Rhizobiaceae bacterium]
MKFFPNINLAILFFGFCICGLNACAKKPEEITAAYVSPLSYQNLTCKQLTTEARRVSWRAKDVKGVQSAKADRDEMVTAAGVILFWPALFFVGGNQATEAEIAKLKGEMQTIENVAIQKNCGIQFSQ